jgi:hypothetical protein
MKARFLAAVALLGLVVSARAQEIEQAIVVQPQPFPGQRFRASENSQVLTQGTYLVSFEMPVGVTVSVNIDVPGPDPTVIMNAQAGKAYKFEVEAKPIPGSSLTGSRGLYFGDLKGSSAPVTIKLKAKKIE